MTDDLKARLERAIMIHPTEATDAEWTNLLAEAMSARTRINELEAMVVKFVAWNDRIEADDDNLTYLNGDRLNGEDSGWEDLRDLVIEARASLKEGE